VGDLEEAIAWYGETLDCRLIRRWSHNSKSGDDTAAELVRRGVVIIVPPPVAEVGR
jgi:hypothetical protein